MTPPRRRPASGASSGPSPAREVAVRVLERVEADASFADLALEAELRARGPSSRDAALATELVFGTLRWQRYLDWILAPHSRRGLDALDLRVRVILRTAAYQIAFLERVPAFAVVNDAVTLAPHTPGVKAFVNAVLRSFANRGVSEREPAPPGDRLDALGTRCSFPTWLVERWVKRYGHDEAETLMRALNERPPLTLRTNTRRTTRQALGQRLLFEEGLACQPTSLAPEGLVVSPGGAPGDWRAFADGSFAVQDEASMLIARLLAPEPGSTIADVCAAPGTKTTHLAQLMDDRGRVVAFDPQPARLARIGEAAARLGLTIIDARPGRDAGGNVGQRSQRVIDQPRAVAGAGHAGRAVEQHDGQPGAAGALRLGPVRPGEQERRADDAADPEGEQDQPLQPPAPRLPADDDLQEAEGAQVHRPGAPAEDQVGDHRQGHRRQRRQHRCLYEAHASPTVFSA